MEYILSILSTALIIFLFITPFSAVAFVIGATPDKTSLERLGLAKKACIYSFFFLAVFCFTGPLLFKGLHIDVAAFRIAGGIILMVAGINMMLPPVSSSSGNNKQSSDITFIPLTFPLMAGPGTITLVLGKTAGKTTFERLGLCASIALALLGIWTCFYICLKGARWLTPTMIKLAERLTGVFIATLAIELIRSGLTEVGFSLFPF